MSESTLRGVAAFDLETDGLDPRAEDGQIVCTAITDAGGTHVSRGLDSSIWKYAILVGQQIKYDLSWARLYDERGFEQWRSAGGKVFCTKLAEYMLSGQIEPGPSLDDIARRCGLPTKPNDIAELIKAGVRASTLDYEKLADYCAHDARVTLAIAREQRKRAPPKLLRLIERHNEALLMTLDAEHEGISVDERQLQDAAAYWGARVADAEATLRGLMQPLLPGIEANQNSVPQLACVLYGGEYAAVVDAPVMEPAPDGSRVLVCKTYKTGARKGQVKTRKEKRAMQTAGLAFDDASGERSTDKLALSKLVAKTDAQRAFLAALAQHRGATKWLTSYVEPWSRMRAPDGKIHTRFIHHLTKTGRLSSAEPNVQNVPKSKAGDPPEASVRRAVVAPPGWRVVEADFAQIEVRVLAQLSGDATLIREINDGKDMHAENAKVVYGAAYTKDQRDYVKRATFALQYGARAKKIAATTGMTLRKAQEFLDAYNSKYQGVASYYERLAASVLATRRTRRLASGAPIVAGHAVGPHGRRYAYRDIESEYGPPAPSPNEIRNFVIQGLATGDISLLQCARLWRILRGRDDVKLINLVHDSVVLLVREDSLTEVAKCAKIVLEDVGELFVEWGLAPVCPFPVEIKAGKNWADLEKLHV